MARLTAHLLKKAVSLTTGTSPSSALAPAFVSASPASAFENQWNSMGNMGGLAGSGVLFNQLVSFLFPSALSFPLYLRFPAERLHSPVSLYVPVFLSHSPTCRAPPSSATCFDRRHIPWAPTSYTRCKTTFFGECNA